MRASIVAVTLTAVLGGSGSALAQPSADEDELALIYGDKSTVRIATGTTRSLRRAPAVATVITAEEIGAIGASDVDEVLETVPGMHVSRASVRYAPMHFMRGIVGSGQIAPGVLLLQDGVPLTTLYNGDKGVDWFGVPVENISRIEVVRGPGSALYGADAYAGVVNVITKTATETRGTEFGLRAGSLSTRNAWLQHGGEWGPVAVAAFLRLGTTDGPRETIAADAQTRNDRLFGTRASLAPGPVNAGHDAVDASLNLAYGKWSAHAGYRFRDNLGTGVGVSSALDPGSKGRVEHFVSDLSWNDEQFAPGWALGFTTSFTWYGFTYPTNLMLLPPGTRLPSGFFPDGVIGGPNHWDRQLRVAANATYTGFIGHTLRFGGGHDDLDLYRAKTIKNNLLNAAGAPIPTGPAIDYSDIQPFIRPHQRKVEHAFIQDEWGFAKDWTLTAGVRHDRYSDFGGTTNPRLAIVWEAAHNLTAKLLYGQAFRAPSFNEQFGINPVANGNPDLRPETIRTLEAALSWQASKDLQAHLNFFRYRARELIRLVPNPSPGVGSTFRNIGNQRGQGFEIEATWDAGRNLRLTGFHAYQKSDDEATRTDVGYMPRQHSYVRADWRFAANWRLSGQLNRVADRIRASGDARPPVADYTTADLTLRTERLAGKWNFALSIRNLTDSKVVEPSLAPGLAIPNDLPLARRTVFLQASYNL